MSRQYDQDKEKMEQLYDEPFIQVQELIYQDQWHLGGDDWSEAMAKLADINKNTRVLDAGCGIGGPARFLAQTFGCQVTGLNISETQLKAANKRTSDKGIEHLVTFKQGSYQDMPFEPNNFDVVWSQDAMAHAQDKGKVIAEAARVLKPSGIMAFQDFVLKGEMTPKLREFFVEGEIPYLETFEGYLAQLKEKGFEVRHKEDLSPGYTQMYKQWQSKTKEAKDEVISICGGETFQKWDRLTDAFVEFLGEGYIGGARFVAQKSS